MNSDRIRDQHEDKGVAWGIVILLLSTVLAAAIVFLAFNVGNGATLLMAGAFGGLGTILGVGKIIMGWKDATVRWRTAGVLVFLLVVCSVLSFLIWLGYKAIII